MNQIDNAADYCGRNAQGFQVLSQEVEKNFISIPKINEDQNCRNGSETEGNTWPIP